MSTNHSDYCVVSRTVFIKSQRSQRTRRSLEDHAAHVSFDQRRNPRGSRRRSLILRIQAKAEVGIRQDRVEHKVRLGLPVPLPHFLLSHRLAGCIHGVAEGRGVFMIFDPRLFNGCLIPTVGVNDNFLLGVWQTSRRGRRCQYESLDGGLFGGGLCSIQSTSNDGGNDSVGVLVKRQDRCDVRDTRDA